MEFEKIQSIISDVLNIEADDITMESTFVDDLGADSLDVFQIVMALEEEFDIEIPDDAAEHITTVGDAVEQIKKAVESKEFDIHNQVLFTFLNLHNFWGI